MTAPDAREATIPYDPTRCCGHLGSYPPYVGGDDDEIDGWRAECCCGFRGRETSSVIVAYGELVAHLTASIRSLARDARKAAEVERLTIERDTYKNVAQFHARKAALAEAVVEAAEEELARKERPDPERSDAEYWASLDDDNPYVVPGVARRIRMARAVLAYREEFSGITDAVTEAEKLPPVPAPAEQQEGE